MFIVFFIYFFWGSTCCLNFYKFSILNANKQIFSQFYHYNIENQKTCFESFAEKNVFHVQKKKNVIKFQ